jgi:anthranilate phosphoribosyltransferase
VSSADGLDELSVSGPTRVVELSGGRTRAYDVRPEEVGVEPAAADSVGAGDPAENARVVRAVLAGEPGTERSLAVVNAAAAIYVGGHAGTLEEGARAAERSIDSGAAAEVLERYVERTRP